MNSHSVCVCHRVEDHSSPLSDPRRQRVEALRREAGRHHATMLHVLRRVHADHAAAVFELLRSGGRAGAAVRAACPGAIGDHLGIGQRDAAVTIVGTEDLRQFRDRLNVVVLRDRPEAGAAPRLRTPRDRLLSAELREDRVWLRESWNVSAWDNEIRSCWLTGMAANSEWEMDGGVGSYGASLNASCAPRTTSIEPSQIIETATYRMVMRPTYAIQ